MKRFLLLVVIVGLMVSGALVSAQAEAPYLYYYSRMLGGIIIEHPDGSDSRLIGADVIPAGLTGIGGPGWSPSGKYFAAYGTQATDNGSIPHGVYVIDRAGNVVNTILSAINPPLMDFYSPSSISWSPDRENLLFVVSDTFQYNYKSRILNFWLVDTATGEIIASDGGVYKSQVGVTNILWEPDQQQIHFYVSSSDEINTSYFRIIMKFNGTVLKESSTATEFQAHYTPSTRKGNDDFSSERGSSPSGNFSAYGYHPSILRNNKTNEIIELPSHTQGTGCRAYRWSPNEDYIITLDGTLVAGGGCGNSVIGITDAHGQLWRELGGCSWDDICAGWLPVNVDVNVPPDQP